MRAALFFLFFLPCSVHALSIAASPDRMTFGPLDTEEVLYIINPSDEELSFSLSTGGGIAVSEAAGTLQPGGRGSVVVTRTSPGDVSSMITISAVEDGVVPGVTIPVTLLRGRQDAGEVKTGLDVRPGVKRAFQGLDPSRKGLLLILAEVTLGVLLWKYLRKR